MLETKEVIHATNLKSKQFENDELYECSICFKIIRNGEIVISLSCDHLYHDGCIRNWLLIRGACPLCRKAVDDMN